MTPSRMQTAPPLVGRLFLALCVAVLFAGITVHCLWRKPEAPPPVSRAEATAARSPERTDPSGAAPATAAPEKAEDPASPPLPGQTEKTSAGEDSPPVAEASPPAAATGALSPAVPPGRPEHAAPADLSWTPLIRRLESDGFDAAAMERLFTSLGQPPLPEFMGQKAVELYGRFGKASLAVSDADRARFAPPDYTRIAGGTSVAAGRRAMDANKTLFEGLYKRYGVPAPFIVAVMMVETGLGAQLGRQSALHALGSMAVTDSLDAVLPVLKGVGTNKDALRDLIKARSDWAYAELKALVGYAAALGRDAAAIPGSVYGAIGICQFMPSNIAVYGASASAKRPVPDLFILADAAASVARYLSAHGWKNAKTPSAQISVLRSYNHSDIYASTVYGVATSLMSPTTHRGADSARKGGDAVRAARENAKASIPSGKNKGVPLDGLGRYSDLLQ